MIPAPRFAWRKTLVVAASTSSHAWGVHACPRAFKGILFCKYLCAVRREWIWGLEPILFLLKSMFCRFVSSHIQIYPSVLAGIL